MSSLKLVRSPTPLHLPGGTVGTSAEKVEIRGRLADGTVLSGLAETLTLDNTHDTHELYVSFNGGNDWVEIPKKSSRAFELQCRAFWIKAGSAGTTWSGIAGIRARYS